MKKFTVMMSRYLETQLKKYAAKEISGEEQEIDISCKTDDLTEVVKIVKGAFNMLKKLGVDDPGSWVGVICFAGCPAELQRLCDEGYCLVMKGGEDESRVK